MNTKTMQGLVGAQVNMNLLDTPFRVYKEARRKGDTATMEQAMGYVRDFSEQADEYKAQADEGMRQDAEEAEEKMRADREEAVMERRKEREEFERKLEEKRDGNRETDTVEISEEGRTLSETARTEGGGAENTDLEAEAVLPEEAGMKKPPVIYRKNGEVSSQEQRGKLSVSV